MGCHRAALLFYAIVLVAHQEVQNVPAVGALGLIQLGIAAVDTADGDELLVLHVEELGEVAAVAWNWSLSYWVQPHLGQTYCSFSMQVPSLC